MAARIVLDRLAPCVLLIGCGGGPAVRAPESSPPAASAPAPQRAPAAASASAVAPPASAPVPPPKWGARLVIRGAGQLVDGAPPLYVREHLAVEVTATGLVPRPSVLAGLWPGMHETQGFIWDQSQVTGPWPRAAFVTLQKRVVGDDRVSGSRVLQWSGTAWVRPQGWLGASPVWMGTTNRPTLLSVEVPAGVLALARDASDRYRWAAVQGSPPVRLVRPGPLGPSRSTPTPRAACICSRSSAGPSSSSSRSGRRAAW